MSGILDNRLDEATYTVFDFETTGMSFENGDKVVELAFVKYSFSDGIIEEFSSLVNPQIPIPYDASGVHGIYDKDVTHAPIFADLSGDIIELIDGSILVGHNVYFDLKFLQGEMSNIGIDLFHPHICTMGLPGFWGGKTRQSLANSCEAHGVKLSNAHSALYDTLATTKILEAQIKTALSNGMTYFRDLKKVKSTYKFVSSWSNPIPTYQNISKNFSHAEPYVRTEFPQIKNTPRPVKFDFDNSMDIVKIHCSTYNEIIVNRIKSLPKRTYEPDAKEWIIPYRADYQRYFEDLLSDVAKLSFTEINLNNTRIVQIIASPKFTFTNGSNGEGCYIATAIYGNYSAKEVLVLREYRDKVLLKSTIGNAFVFTYYKLSPGVAKFLSTATYINLIVKFFLDNFVSHIEKIMQKKARHCHGR